MHVLNNLYGRDEPAPRGVEERNFRPDLRKLKHPRFYQ